MIEEVADKIYKFRLPMPGRLDHINVYLVKETRRVAMVDTGLPTPDSWKALNDHLAALNMRFSDVTDLFITHSHPDHIGQMHRIRREAPEIKVHIHRREMAWMQERSIEDAEKRMREWMMQHGAADLLEGTMPGRMPRLPQFEPQDNMLEGGEKLDFGEGPEGQWEIMWTPGHTAGHFVIHNRARHMMLSGDHLLGQISSNVGKYPGSTEDPLGDYISSLNKITALELQHVFPAHGLPFSDYRERLAHLMEHHRDRLAKMYAAVEKEPRTAAQIVKQIWGDRLHGFDRYLALVETLSHMERLMREKKVIPELRGEITYFRAA